MSVTLRFQSTGTVPGNARPISMVGPSLTIGRGDENDLVLPDPDKLISKRHCVIEDHGGNIIVIDLSTNGTFLNYGKTALGRVSTPLNDGDILTLGTYELMVEIRGGASAATGIPAPLEDLPVSQGRAAAAEGLGSLLDDPSSSSGGLDFLDELLGAPAPAGPAVVKRPDLADDGLLPPMGVDDLLGPLGSAPPEPTGPAMSSHNPAFEDHFTPARIERHSAAIPDDWDDLLAPLTPEPAEDRPASGSGAANPENPFLQPTPAPPEPPQPPVAVQAPPIDPFVTLPPTSPRAAPPEVPPPPPADPVPPPPVSRAPEPPAPVPPVPAPSAAASGARDDAAARAFLKSVGAEHLSVPEADLVPTMARLGHVLRVMITGMREVLMTRSSIKSEFRINQTRITSGGNNPLKFSISPEQAIEAMVRPTTRGYLDAVEASEQALSDIKAHEVAVMTGMEAALKGILKRLDPATLEAKIETGGGIGSILKGRKARYWEVYEKMYAEISDQAQNDFHELFAREFARAYQEQLEKLK